MAAETLIEIYRTNEKNGSYSNSVVLLFFLDQVLVKGLAKPLTRQEAQEVYSYLKTTQAATVVYERKGRIKTRSLKSESQPKRDRRRSRREPIDGRQSQTPRDAL